MDSTSSCVLSLTRPFLICSFAGVITLTITTAGTRPNAIITVHQGLREVSPKHCSFVVLALFEGNSCTVGPSGRMSRFLHSPLRRIGPAR